MHQSFRNIFFTSDIALSNAQRFENPSYKNDSHTFLLLIVDYSKSDDILLGTEEATQIL